MNTELLQVVVDEDFLFVIEDELAVTKLRFGVRFQRPEIDGGCASVFVAEVMEPAIRDVQDVARTQHCVESLRALELRKLVIIVARNIHHRMPITWMANGERIEVQVIDGWEQDHTLTSPYLKEHVLGLVVVERCF